MIQSTSPLLGYMHKLAWPSGESLKNYMAFLWVEVCQPWTIRYLKKTIYDSLEFGVHKPVSWFLSPGIWCVVQIQLFMMDELLPSSGYRVDTELSCCRWNCISSHHTVIVFSVLGCSLLFCILLCLSFPVEITKFVPSSWSLITCLTNERTRAERTEWQKDLLIWFTSFTLLTPNTGLIYVIIQGTASTADTPKLSQTGNRLVRKMV